MFVVRISAVLDGIVAAAAGSFILGSRFHNPVAI